MKRFLFAATSIVLPPAAILIFLLRLDVSYRWKYFFRAREDPVGWQQDLTDPPAKPLPRIIWEAYENPSAFDMRRMVILKPDNIFCMTQNAILHFNGKAWRKIFSTPDCQIWDFDTDGQFLVTSMDTLGQDLIAKPKVYIFRVQHNAGKVQLIDLQTVLLPLSHSPASILFVEPGIVLLGNILEYAVLEFPVSDKNLFNTVKIQAGALKLTSNEGAISFFKNFTGEYLILRVRDAMASTLIKNREWEHGFPVSDLKYLFRPEMLSLNKDTDLSSDDYIDIQKVSFLDSTFYAAKISRSLLLVFDNRMQPALRFFDKIAVGKKDLISVKDVQAITVDTNRHLYAMTKSGRFLRGELIRGNSPRWKWETLGQLPITNVWEMQFVSSSTLVMSGNIFIRVKLYENNQDLKAEQRQFLQKSQVKDLKEQFKNKIPVHQTKNDFKKPFLFNVLPPFNPGTTYGIGIGKLDSKNNVYIYLADVYNKNRLFIIDETYNFDKGGQNFTDYAEKRGLLGRRVPETNSQNGISLAINFGDVNEDGADDLVVSYLDSSDALYLNNGQGYFRDVSLAYNLMQTIGRSECVLLADVNNDGYLDLFTTSFVNTNRLFVNQNGGRFVETTASSGLQTSGLGITAAFGDIDNDGFEDLYVGNWDAENYLYLNNGDGTFREVSAERGVQFGSLHKTNSVLMADFNNDGALDIFVGNRGVGNRLFLNDCQGFFQDVTKQAGINDRAIVYGSVFGDFDNDGWLDLFLAAAGEVLFYRNTGVDPNGVPHFKNDTHTVLPFMRYYKGYNTGMATWDAEHDGDLDVLMGQFRGGSLVFRNILNSPIALLLQPEKGNKEAPNFLEVTLEGVKSNRNGLGAKLWLYENDHLIGFREIASGYGYASSSSRVQHFGIPPVSPGQPAPRYRLVVKFPATNIQKELTVFPGQWVQVKEMEGFAATKIYWQKSVARILANLPSFIGFSISSRALELMLIVIILVIGLKIFSYSENRKGYSFLPADHLYVMGFSILIYLCMMLLLFIQKKFFMSPLEWTSGEGNIFLDHWVPVGATITGSIILLGFRHKEIYLRSLRAEIYDRLYDLLKKFRHGEGGYQNLNRLAFFAENMPDVFRSLSGQTSVDEKKSTLRFDIWLKIFNANKFLHKIRSWFISHERKPWIEKFPEMNPSIRRFLDAIEDFREKTYPDLQQMSALLKMIPERNSSDLGVNSSEVDISYLPGEFRKNGKRKTQFANMENDALGIQANQLLQVIFKVQQMINSHSSGKKSYVLWTRLQKQMRSHVQDLQKSILLLIKHFDRWYVTDISESLQNTYQKFSSPSQKLKGKKKNSEIKIDLEEKIPPAKVVAGKRDIEEVLSILIQNSIEAFFERKEAKEANKIRIISEQEDSNIRIIVEDNGPGVREEDLMYLFRRGFTLKHGGHGFGLWHAREVLSKYGGKIWYDNTYEGGARFVIELRLA